MKTKTDGRYTITQEFCGYPEARYVLRFCGAYIGQNETLKESQNRMTAYKVKREESFYEKHEKESNK